MPDPQNMQQSQFGSDPLSPVAPQATPGGAGVGHPVVQALVQALARGAQTYGAVRMPDSQRLPREEMAANIALRKQMMENMAAYRGAQLGQGQERIDVSKQRARGYLANIESQMGRRLDQTDLDQLKAEISARGKGMTTGQEGVETQTPSQLTAPLQAGLEKTKAETAFTSGAKTAEAEASTGLKKAQTSAIPERLALENKRINMEAGLRSQIIGLRKQGLDVQMGSRMEKLYEPAQDADTRYKVMLKAAENPSAQGDVQLLFNHMGMTLGAQKGARMTDAEIRRAQAARSVPQDIQALYQKAVNGQMLTPEQRDNMVKLASDMREQQWAKADQLAGTLTNRQRPGTIADQTNAAPPLNITNQGPGKTIGGSTGPKKGDVQNHMGAMYKFDGKQWNKQ